MKTLFKLSQRIPFAQNVLFQALTLSFFLCWIGFCITTRSQVNWWIENILVILFVPWFICLQKKFLFSQLSLCCIFLFLFIHIYGAQMSYTYNGPGLWLQKQFHLERNPYDRIVHFGFGLLIVYPIYDYLKNGLQSPPRWTGTLAVMIILCLACLFELIEWVVASFTDTETGESYVATQGDVWDAHKDIALALLAAVMVIVLKRWLQKKYLKNV